MLGLTLFSLSLIKKIFILITYR